MEERKGGVTKVKWNKETRTK